MPPELFGLILVIGNSLVALKISEDYDAPVGGRMACAVLAAVGVVVVFYVMLMKGFFAWLEFLAKSAQ